MNLPVTAIARLCRALLSMAVQLLALPVEAQIVPAPDSPQIDTPLFPPNSSSADIAFGAQIGAGSSWTPSLGSGSSKSGAPIFAGGIRMGCTGIDFDGFLRTFDPHELLGELRNSLLSGAQAAASNFVLTLAYSDPTVASVLDMMDKKYAARFSAFAQACNAQAAHALGEQPGQRALGDAGDQCFSAEVARGSAPTEAYRRCSIQRQFDGMDLPAAASNVDFLRRFTTVPVSSNTEALMGLLPDHRIASGSLQLRAPESTVAWMTDRLRTQARTALDRIDAGTSVSQIETCEAGALTGITPIPEGCIPPGSAPLLTSPAFRSSRLLSPASREIFKDALANQIAVTAMYDNLLELKQRLDKIDVRDGAAADASHAENRRRFLKEASDELLREAEFQVKAQAARNEIVRSEMQALENIRSGLNARATELRSASDRPSFSARDLLHAFVGND